MADSSLRRSELARWIVEHEVGGSPDSANVAAALETACGRLKSHLVDLLGSGGVAALLRRALHLAQREEPLLTGVTVIEDPLVCFAGLTESLGTSADDDAVAAAVAVLTHLLDLLIMLLGEDLGTKPIRKIWPQATCEREMDE